METDFGQSQYIDARKLLNNSSDEIWNQEPNFRCGELNRYVGRRAARRAGADGRLVEAA